MDRRSGRRAGEAATSDPDGRATGDRGSDDRSGPGRKHGGRGGEPPVTIWLYLLGLGLLSAVIISLSYVLFSGGFDRVTRAFLADPSGTLQARPLFVLVLLGVFASVFLLVALIVYVGAQHIEPERVDDARDDR